ncbi:RNA polymerase sigma factor [Candidatus Uhrbacteria bacterium]|nr:RNA polymerase sigma factor [Candidatus Uhrbacteria bacterium]
MRPWGSSERDIIRRAQEGDRAAITVLWDAHTPKLYGYLCHTLRDPVIAEDVLQQTWVQAMEALGGYRDRGVPFHAWLFAIARNVCRQHWRTLGREVPLDLETHDVPAPNRNHDAVLTVDAALRTLTEEDRELLRLRYIADLPIASVARVLGIRPITARVRLHRTLRRARAALETHHV